MTFPGTLTVTVELALDAPDLTDPDTWVWTDASPWVRQTSPVSITRGRSDETATSTPATVTLVGDNTDGRWSRLNPAGAWYGRIGRNTPIRVTATPSWDIGQAATRFTGYLSEGTLGWDSTGANRYVEITASGVLRRLTKGSAGPSPLRTFVLGTGPLAYWPCEDAVGATSAASAVGGRPAVNDGAAAQGLTLMEVQFGAVDGPPGSRDTPVWPYGFLSLNGSLPATSSTEWTAAFCYYFDSGTADTGLGGEIARLYCDDDSGTIATWVMTASNLGVQLRALDADGTQVTFSPPDGGDQPYQPFNARWHTTVIRLRQSGSAILLDLWIDGTQFETGLSLGTNTLTPIVGVGIVGRPLASLSVRTRSVAHASIWNGYPTGLGTGYHRAAMGYPGEVAADRVTRAAAEAGVPVTIVEGGASSEPLGAQEVQPVLDILRDAEAADGGCLYEGVGGRLVYRARSAYYDAAVNPPVLAVSVTDLVDDFAPTDDDDWIVNDATVRRYRGSDARHVDEVSIETIGRYDQSVTLTVADDDRADAQAAWLVHRGTTDGYRYPAASLDLGRRPELIPAWTNVDIGSRVVISQPRPGLPPDDIDCIVEQISEELTAVSWRVRMALSPAAPWRAARVGDDVLGRADTAGSHLVDAVDAAATVLRVGTDAGPPWIMTATHPGEFPFDVSVAGERVTVTAIHPGVADAFARTETAGWGTADTGQVWETSGGAPSDYSVDGSRAVHTLTAVNAPINSTLPTGVDRFDASATLQCPVLATGAAISVSLLALWTDAANYYGATIMLGTDQSVRIRLDKRVGGSFSQLFLTAPLPLAAATTTTLGVRFSVADGFLCAKVWDTATMEPPTWQACTYDTALVGFGAIGFRSALVSGNTNSLPVAIYFDDVAMANVQDMTVSRSTNGITEPHPAGTDVRLWQPVPVAL